MVDSQPLAANKDAYGVYVPETVWSRGLVAILCTLNHISRCVKTIWSSSVQSRWTTRNARIRGYKDGKVKLFRANPEDEILIDENDVQIMDRISMVVSITRGVTPLLTG